MNPLLEVGRRLVIAHRGASAYAPENTLPAFALAAEQGADACELDVHVGADGEAVVTHDPPRGGGQPRLAEVLAAFPQLHLIVEIKDPRAQEPVRQALRAAGAESRCVVASELHDALTRFRGGGFLLGASRRDITWLWLRSRLRWPPLSVRYRCLAVPERHGRLQVVTPRFVADARRLGCPVHVWTVNDPNEARRLWAMGVSGIITDDPPRILQAR